MRPETAISLAMLALYQDRHGENLGYRTDVVEKLKVLLSKNIPVRGIRMRPGIGGDYSDEVSDFVGRLVVAGYAVQESPIKLTPNGVQLIKQHLANHFGDQDVKRGAEALEIGEDLLHQRVVPAN